MQTPTILIVDDQPDNFDAIEALLLTQNYQLHYAASGQVALDILESFTPDLILLDVMMPGMDGIEVCQRVKSMEKYCAVPIMMVTALNTKADLARCLQVGADDFISKPVNALELRARIQSLLRIRQQYNQIQGLLDAQVDTAELLDATLHALGQNLATTISRGMSTPLQGMVSTLLVLQECLRDNNISSAQKILNQVLTSARQIEQLTRRSRLYIDLELVETQLWETSSLPTQVSALAVQADLMILAGLHHRDQDMVFSLEDRNVMMPESYLLILLHELVNNALRFSSAGTKVLVQIQNLGRILSIAVHDSGQGISEDNIAKIKAFMTLDRQNFDPNTIGIGLKIIQKIMNFGKGTFSITSKIQRGTTVTILLPMSSEPSVFPVLLERD